ncbi:MAG: hypothetical protein C5B50_05710 [Verrucomicrobia bacterium]|nr:MAG: hypothetical protein C5B50_05710 [Verrucomicrobiota bacterium]
MTNQQVNLIRRDLAGKITGRVLLAGDEGFSGSLAIDNGRVSLRPFIVALPGSTQDVASIVSYCHELGVPLTTKAGGHSAAGYCLNSEGVVLDLGDMNNVTLSKDGTKISIEAGTRWIKVYDFLRDLQSPYTVIGGGCAGVGVAGFTLGGGYSFISRSYGLGCDNVNGMQFVSPCGNILDVDNKLFTDAKRKKDTDSVELYRALRGAGGGNFGIVTRIDLQLQKTNVPRPTMGQITFPFYRINEILEFYNKWVLTLPNEMAVYGMMRNFPDPRFGGRSSLALRFTPVYNGKFTDAVDLLKPLMALGPNDVELYTMTLPQWEDFVGTSTQVKGRSAYIRSLVFAPKTLTNDVAEICKYYFGRSLSDDSFIVWTHTGGRIRDFGSAQSCYAHRDGEFTFELKSEWNAAQPAAARSNIEWAVDFFDALGDHAQGAYINYIDPLLSSWQKQYYRNEYDRLVKVQNRWNKDRWLNFQQAIGSDYDAPPHTKPLDLSPLTRTFLRKQ